MTRADPSATADPPAPASPTEPVRPTEARDVDEPPAAAERCHPAEAPATWEQRFHATWRRRIGTPVEALDDALALAEEVAGCDDALTRARVALLEGSCRWRVGDYPGALERLLGCVELVPDDHPRERAAALADLGVVRNYFGQADEATALMLESLALREKIGDEAGRGDVLNNLGIVRYHRGDLDEAARDYREAAQIRVRLGDQDGVAAVRNNLGKVLTDQGEPHLAREALEAAADAWERLGNVRGLGMAENNLALVSVIEGDDATAAARFERSLRLKAQAGDRHGTCETLVHLARLALRQDELDRARQLLARARQEAEALGIRPWLVEVCRALADVEEAAGDHRQALTWFRRFHAEERALYDERAGERLRALQIAHRLERAEREGVTDQLTGLANRRGFERRLLEELERSTRDATPLTVALLDLDDFKAINDRFGHPIGDEVLRRVASLLTDHTRTADLPARYGGEEFALLLPATSVVDARSAAESVRARIADHGWAGVHPDLRVTVSIGLAAAGPRDVVAARSGAPVEGPSLLERADHHLYRAKHAGKDQVRG